jgi:class I fructose-bisphosphate aldolase
VIESASGKPVLLRGGSRVPDKELLSRTYALMRQGAAGVVYRRNIYQHRHPARILEACSAIVHKNASVAEAEIILNGTAS